MQRKIEQQNLPKYLESLSSSEFALLQHEFPRIMDALSENSLDKLNWLFTLLSGKVNKKPSLPELGYSFSLLDTPPQDEHGDFNLDVQANKVYFYLEKEEIKYMYLDLEYNKTFGTFSADLTNQLIFLKEKLQNLPHSVPLSQAEEISLFSLLSPQGITPHPQTIHIANLFKYILFTVADDTQAINLIHNLFRIKDTLGIIYGDILAYNRETMLQDVLDAGEFEKAERLTRVPKFLYPICLAKLYGGSPLEPSRIDQLVKDNIKEKNNLIYQATLSALRCNNYKFALELINSPLFMDYSPLDKPDVEKLQNILVDLSAHVDDFNFFPLPEKLQVLSSEFILQGYAKGGHVQRVNEWIARGGNIDAAFRGYKAANNKAEMSKLAAMGATTEDEIHTKILNFASELGYKPIGGFCLGHTSFISLKILFLMNNLKSMTDVASFLNKNYFNPVCDAAKKEDNSVLIETYNSQLQQQKGTFWQTEFNNIKFNRIFEYFDAASLFTFPEGYKELFETPEINPYLTPELLHLLLPENCQGKIENEMFGAVNYLSLQEYIDDLDALKTCILKANTDAVIPLHIFTQQHSILITYDKETDRWLCADMNQLPLKFYNTEATAQFIKKAFPTSGLGISYFISEETKEAVNNVVNAWKETDAFKQNRELSNRIHYKYHVPYSPSLDIPLFDMAVHANDVATIKVLCEKFQQNPNTFIGIRSSNHPAYAAARFGHFETFKYLLEHPATSFRSLSLQNKLYNVVIQRGEPEFLFVLLEHTVRKFESSAVRQFIKAVLDDSTISDDAAFCFCHTLHKIDAETYNLDLEVQHDHFRSESFKIQLAELTANQEQIKPH